jgi:hypothetical protein
MSAGIVAFGLALAVAGCSGSSTAPTASTLVPLPVVPSVPALGPVLTGVSLSGVVSEQTSSGRVPIAGLNVYCEPCGASTHSWAKTDAEGFYSFSGDLARGGGVWLSSGIVTAIWAGHDGFQDPPGLPPLTGPLARLLTGPGWREVLINGDTRFDIQLVRR